MATLTAIDASRARRDADDSNRTGDAWAAAMRDTDPSSHVARASKWGPGETLGEISSRYGVSVGDLLAANPSVRDANLIHAGQAIAIPGDRGSAPGRHVVAPGETLGGIAAASRISPNRIADANGLSDPDRIRAGQHLWIPGSRGQAAAWPATPATAPAGPTGAPVQAAEPAPAAPATAAFVRAAPSSAAPSSAAAATAEGARTVIDHAKSEHDPARAVQALSAGMDGATPQVRAAVLADPAGKRIIDDAAHWANEPMTQQAMMPQAAAAEAVHRLDGLAATLDHDLAGAVAKQTLPGYRAFHADPNHGGQALFGQRGTTALLQLGGRIAGSADGRAALDGFAALDAWNGDAVRNGIAAGADPAYPIALAHHMQAGGHNPTTVVQAIADGLNRRDTSAIAVGGSPAPVMAVARRLEAAGVAAAPVRQVAVGGVEHFKDQVGRDVGRLAKQNGELAWLVKNAGAGLAPAQLGAAVAADRNQQGSAWQKQDAALRDEVAQDGGKLLDQMIALNAAQPQGQGSYDATLRSIANDPRAGLAISAALRADPKLGDADHVSNLAGLFTLSKVGDIGRKFAGEAAASIVRRSVLNKLQGVDLSHPGDVARARQAIQSLSSEGFAKLIGVAPGDTKKAVDALQKAVDRASAHPEQADAALGDLNSTLNRDAALSKAFNKTTLPGQLLRGVGVAFAGASLLNSAGKFAGHPEDPQNGVKLLVDSSGFAQKNAELLVGLGQIDKASTLAQFGGEWKLVGRASAGDLISGVSAVLDGLTAVRSGFGLGVKQDSGSAFFSAVSSAGGIMATLPAFGAAAWLGPAGLGLAAVGVIGNAVYQNVKEAHQYEGASRVFLKGAGYNDAAARALGQQGGLMTGATGASPMPFLNRYAEMRHLTPAQVTKWVNSLTPEQASTLSACLLQTAGDSQGNPARFTAGPTQTDEVQTGEGRFATLTLANTLQEFERHLTDSHVPHP